MVKNGTLTQDSPLKRPRKRSVKKMPKPDVALKDYFKDLKKFADLFNTTVFKNTVILPEDLKETSDSYADSIKRNGELKTILRQRDLIYKAGLGVYFVILGVENQDKIHYAMPVRKMIMDSLGYLAECKKKGVTKDSKDWNADEYLSGIKKGTTLTPIITIIFYTGEKEWDGPRSLHDMLDLDDRMKPYVPDYPLYVIDFGHDNYNFKNKDLKELQKALKLIYGGRGNECQDTFSNSTLAMAGILAKAEGIYQNVVNKEGETVMCEALQKMVDEAVAKKDDEINALKKEKEDEIKEKDDKIKEQEAVIKALEAQLNAVRNKK
jgi:hypothetical protein